LDSNGEGDSVKVKVNWRGMVKWW